MPKLTVANSASEPGKRPVIKINLKRKTEDEKGRDKTVKRVLENRFEDLLQICKSISENKQKINPLYCDEELERHVVSSRERGIASSRSYRLDLPEIREIEEENQEERGRNSICLTERQSCIRNKKEIQSTEDKTNHRSYDRAQSFDRFKQDLTCSPFSISETLINYGSRTLNLRHNRRPTTTTKCNSQQKYQTVKAPKVTKIDVGKLLASGRSNSNRKHCQSHRKIKSSIGQYSHTHY